MKAEELRIGNFVNWNNEIAKIKQIFELEVGFKCGDIGLFEDLESILLSEEWLLKFGFERLGSGRFDFKTFTYYLHDGSFYNQTSRLCTIKYVHQLQNLHFALTGEELKYVA